MRQEFFVVIPMTMLLVVSFFVLITARKIDSRGIKAFGYVVTCLLWICAAFILFVGPSMCPMKNRMMPMKHKMMQGGHNMPQQPMMMPEGAVPQK